MSVEKEAAERKFRDEEWQQWRDERYSRAWREKAPVLTYADYMDRLMEGIRRS